MLTHCRDGLPRQRARIAHEAVMTRLCTLGWGRSLTMACVQVDESGGAKQSCQRQQNVPAQRYWGG